MKPTREPTGAEALDRIMDSVTPQFLAHWEVGYKIHQEESTQMRDWTIELVKHLVIINAAGLAGSITLITMQLVEMEGRFHLAWTGALFVFGLVMAVLDMYFNSLGHLSRVKEMRRRIDELRRLYQDSSFEIFEKIRIKTVEAPFKNEILFPLGAICGWLSALSFLGGITGIYRAIKPLIH